MATNEQLIETLKTITDPEIGIDIWTLGLVYNIQNSDGKVKITMTLTSPMCPYGPQIIAQVKADVAKLNGVKEAQVDVTFDPPWQPSEDLRMMLGV